MQTHLFSPMSQRQTFFLPTHIFSFFPKINDKIAAIALGIFSAIAVLLLISRCFKACKINSLPAQQSASQAQKYSIDFSPKNLQPISSELTLTDRIKEKMSASSPFSESEDSPPKNTQPEISDEEFAPAFAQNLVEENDLLLVQTIKDDGIRESNEQTPPLASLLTVKNLNLDSSNKSKTELIDEEIALYLAQQFAEEDGGNLESVLKLQQEFDREDKKIKPITPLRPTNQNLYASTLSGKPASMLNQIPIKDNLIKPLENALQPAAPSTKILPGAAVNAVSISKIEDVWTEIGDGASTTSSFYEKINPLIHHEIDTLLNEIITTYETDCAVHNKAIRGMKFNTLAPLTKYEFLIGIYNLYLQGPSIVDDLCKLQTIKDKNQFLNKINEVCLPKLQSWALGYISTENCDHVILTATRLPYLLAEVTQLAKKYKKGESLKKFYKALFKEGISVGCFRDKTYTLFDFCLKWKGVFDSEEDARSKLAKGEFGEILKHANHTDLIKNAIDQDQLSMLISELDLDRNNRPYEKWLDEEQSKIIDFLTQKKVWENALYQEKAGKTYFLINKSILKTALKQVYTSLIW